MTILLGNFGIMYLLYYMWHIWHSLPSVNRETDLSVTGLPDLNSEHKPKYAKKQARWLENKPKRKS